MYSTVYHLTIIITAIINECLWPRQLCPSSRVCVASLLPPCLPPSRGKHSLKATHAVALSNNLCSEITWFGKETKVWSKPCGYNLKAGVLSFPSAPTPSAGRAAWVRAQLCCFRHEFGIGIYPLWSRTPCTQLPPEWWHRPGSSLWPLF